MTETITADKEMNREQRNREAYRLTKVTGREIDFRTVDCDCDEWKCCAKCGGSGAYHEAFFLSCNHRVFDGDDLECAGGCAERERRRSEEAAA